MKYFREGPEGLLWAVKDEEAEAFRLLHPELKETKRTPAGKWIRARVIVRAELVEMEDLP